MEQLILENIETERTILRALTVNDIEDLFDTYSNAEAMKYRYNSPILSLGEALMMVKQAQHNLESQKSVRWGIEEKESGKLIGTIIWFPKRKFIPDEVGYSIHRNWWGKGLMTEVLNEVLYYLKSIGVERVRARVHRDNLASQKVLEKSGFIKKPHTKTDTILQFMLFF